MNKRTLEEWDMYLFFMGNKSNFHNCDHCPENIGVDDYKNCPCGKMFCTVKSATRAAGNA